jgi:hypothetical protein
MEQSMDTCYNMDETWKQNGQQKVMYCVIPFEWSVQKR